MTRKRKIDCKFVENAWNLALHNIKATRIGVKVDEAIFQKSQATCTANACVIVSGKCHGIDSITNSCAKKWTISLVKWLYIRIRNWIQRETNVPNFDFSFDFCFHSFHSCSISCQLNIIPNNIPSWYIIHIYDKQNSTAGKPQYNDSFQFVPFSYKMYTN